MLKLRDFLIFLAGASFFHALSHAVFPYFVKLPLNMHFLLLTPQLNMWMVVVYLLVSVLFMLLARRIK